MKIAVANLLMLCLSAGSLAACGGRKINVNGIEVYERHWHKALDELQARVAFDMDCSADQATFVLFKRAGRVPSEVGVTGCAKRGMYLRTVGAGTVGPWVLNLAENTDINVMTPPPPPPHQ